MRGAMKTVIEGEDRPTLTEQCSEISREQTMRNRVYPKLIKSGKLSSSEAQTQMRNMAAAYETLTWLKKNADTVKAAHRQIREKV